MFAYIFILSSIDYEPVNDHPETPPTRQKLPAQDSLHGVSLEMQAEPTEGIPFDDKSRLQTQQDFKSPGRKFSICSNLTDDQRIKTIAVQVRHLILNSFSCGTQHISSKLEMCCVPLNVLTFQVLSNSNAL